MSQLLTQFENQDRLILYHSIIWVLASAVNFFTRSSQLFLSYQYLIVSTFIVVFSASFSFWLKINYQYKKASFYCSSTLSTQSAGEKRRQTQQERRQNIRKNTAIQVQKLYEDKRFQKLQQLKQTNRKLGLSTNEVYLCPEKSMQRAQRYMQELVGKEKQIYD